MQYLCYWSSVLTVDMVILFLMQAWKLLPYFPKHASQQKCPWCSVG